MTKIYTRIIIFILFILTSSSIFGQGILRGIVTDSLAVDPLVGANVQLIGTAFGNAVDIEGNYRVLNIHAGQYTVRASYVGYKSKDLRVNIKDNETVTLNFRLVADVIQGKEIIVSAQALGQAAAINQQLTSNTIINVISEEKIQELPDANAAEAIGRLPGVSIIRSGGEASQVLLRGMDEKYSTITIDGVRIQPTATNDRGIDLSAISQGSLAGVELFKALTSDKDADAIAGSVNLVTKKAPSERLLRFEPRGSYNAMDKSVNQYNFQGRYGERFFDNALGLQVSGNFERVIRSNESTDYNYDLTGISNGTDYVMTQFSPTYVNEIRKRAGGSVILDYNTPDGGSIRLNTVLNQTFRTSLNYNRTYPQTGTVLYNFRDQESWIKELTSALHGENYLLGFQVNWNVSFAQSSANKSLDYSMQFEEDANNANGVQVSGMRAVPVNLYKGPEISWFPYSMNNFNMAFLANAEDQTQKNLDRENNVILDILKKYTLSENITGEFKFGGKYRTKSRYSTPFDAKSNYYLYPLPAYVRLADGTFVSKSLVGTRFEDLKVSGGGKILMNQFLDPTPVGRNIYGIYELYPLVVRDALREWRNININGYVAITGAMPQWEYWPDYTVTGSNYNLSERVYAGYLMNTLNFGHDLTLITGLRIESDDNSYTSAFTPLALGGFPYPFGTLNDTTVYHKETAILPNVQSIIRPSEFWNIRLAAYKALARPDFNQRLLKYVAKSASGNTLAMGNPDLKDAIGWNYEIQNQFYGNDIGLISISLFYKEIKNMFQTIPGVTLKGTSVLDSLGVPWRSFSQAYNGNFVFGQSEYTISYPYNSDKPTKVWGLEFEHQANFRFLPGLLRNIVLNYNLSFIRSETWVTSSKVVNYRDSVKIGPIWIHQTRSKNVLIDLKQKLQSQPEFFANVSLGYDLDGFSFRISLFYEDQYNNSFSSNQRSDGIENSFTKWDLAIKQKVTDNISVSLNVNNISNNQNGTTIANRITGWMLPNGNSRYGTTADLGVRIDL